MTCRIFCCISTIYNTCKVRLCAFAWQGRAPCSSLRARRHLRLWLCTAQAGQASVEAAVMLPCILFLFAILAQTCVIGYTRAVMVRAASQTVRVAACDFDGSFTDCSEFARRRLKAIPNLAIFHKGASTDWKIDISREGKATTVTIKGDFEPLPFFGLFVQTIVGSGENGAQLTVSASQKTQASWVEGTYDEWQTMWSAHE